MLQRSKPPCCAMMETPVRLFPFVALVLVVVGCAGGDAERCRVGAECMSGVCRSDGTCAPRLADGGSDAAMVEDDGGPMVDIDAAGLDDGGPPVDGGARVCTANGDGTIDRAELPLRAGLYATFRTASDATVDTAGASLGDGTRRWDFSGALTGDADVRRELVPVTGTWWAPEFVGAGWSARLSESSELRGVFEITDTALLLRGVVSPADGATRTLLTYEPAVVVLQLPLRAGDSWETVSTVTGQASGIAVYYTETYSSSVDASGELVAPFGTFDVLRVRTTLDRMIGLLATRIRSFSFVSECFGTVASASSEDNETTVEFTTASEVSRLSP